MFMSHVEFVIEHPGVPRMMFGELQRAESSPAKRMAQTLIQRYAERLRARIEAGKAGGEIATEVDTQAAATCSSAPSRAWSCSPCCPATSNASALTPRRLRHLPTRHREPKERGLK
jgi:hypothetical protein